MSSVDWKDQYSRMIRWRKRLDELTSDSGYDIQDFYFAFFQNCHHLSYWLYEGNCLEEKEVKNFVHNNEYLSVCEGIANGTKHFKTYREVVFRSLQRIFFNK